MEQSKPSLLAAGKKINFKQRQRARKLVMQALYQWQLSPASTAEIEAQFRAANKGKIDWDFFHEVLSGVLADVETLDQLLSPLLDREIKSLDPLELSLLRMGSFELSKRIDVPYKVVINEAIELAKGYGATESHKYINSVLDKLALDLRSLEIKAAKQ